MIKAVVIDVDDTLCLTEAACFEMENDVLSRIGRPPMPRDIHIKTWGKPLFEVISERSPGLNLEDFKREYAETIPEYVAAGKLDDIAQENYRALDKLIKTGKSVMLLTSRTHGELKHLLELDHLLAKRITAFFYRDNMQFHKPDPRAFDTLLKGHGLRPQDCVYVGDSISDAVAANKAGLHFIASLESGLRKQEDFNGYDVDAFINHFSELPAAVESTEKV